MADPKTLSDYLQQEEAITENTHDLGDALGSYVDYADAKGKVLLAGCDGLLQEMGAPEKLRVDSSDVLLIANAVGVLEDLKKDKAGSRDFKALMNPPEQSGLLSMEQIITNLTGLASFNGASIEESQKSFVKRVKE